MRVESLRTYRTNVTISKKWMSLLPGISTEGSRNEKFKKVLDTLKRIEENYPVEQY